jgi:ADP-ribosylglycohydrolase
MAPMAPPSSSDPANTPDWTLPRPIDASYWVVPGRLLVGEHPGSRSRAQSMERLRRFLEAGVTCFIDLTEPREMSGYEMLLPFETPTGRRVEYLREPIIDHGVPADRETMGRIVAMIDGALDTGHCVYLHCRAGIGRSAMAAGCWLAERNAVGGEAALVELADLWPQCVQSRSWRNVPETPEQAAFVRSWQPLRLTGPLDGRVRRTPAAAAQANVEGAGAPLLLQQRVRGAWHGLALGDALGHSDPADAEAPLGWTQHTALTLCLAESLASVNRCDARDQIERYWRWLKDGYCDARGEPGASTASPDIAKALATYRWRGQPMAGSHDPRDVSANSLPRVLAAVLHAGSDVTGAIALAAECSRTTHQSPLVLDACRLYAATLAAALRGQAGSAVLLDVPEPAAGCFGNKPLRKDVRSACTVSAAGRAGALPEVLRVLVHARRIVNAAPDFTSAIVEARRVAVEDGSPLAAITGTLYGALHGFDALPPAAVARLVGRDPLELACSRGAVREVGAGVGA